MKKLLLVSLLAAATTVLACNSSEKAAPAAAPADSIAPAAADGQPKQTRIHFTNNYHKGTNPGQYDTNCIGIVTTEQIKADKKQKIMWKISLINGESRDDECTGLTDLSSVNLRFENDVMGPAAVKKLTANSGGVIQGEISDDEAHYNNTRIQKYQVYIGDKKAGPDPIIVVPCSSCGEEE